MWNKIENGLPPYDVSVLWETEDGNHFVAEIDKDDVDWWNGIYGKEGICWRPRCTHWKKIVSVAEELENENQKCL